MSIWNRSESMKLKWVYEVECVKVRGFMCKIRKWSEFHTQLPYNSFLPYFFSSHYAVVWLVGLKHSFDSVSNYVYIMRCIFLLIFLNIFYFNFMYHINLPVSLSPLFKKVIWTAKLMEQLNGTFIWYWNIG